MPAFLQNKSVPFVPAWRRKFALRKTAFFLRKGWRRAVEYGQAEQFVTNPDWSKVTTEEDFVKAMDRLFEWETEEDKKQHREITYQTPPARLAE